MFLSGIGFNSRPRTGGDVQVPDFRLQRPVSTHAPARGATSPLELAALVPQFQLTPPHGGRHQRRRPPPRGSCFNSRPRTGGDLVVRHFAVPSEVSTHAPARGATATPALRPERNSFNSRPRTGGDLLPVSQCTRDPVSTHAPARGATRAGCTRISWGRFNSRPRTGGDT